jgi:hypothetical protein
MTENNDDRQKFIKAFQDEAVAFAGGVYTLRLTKGVDMEYRIVCKAMDMADLQFPPDEEGNHLPQWAQVKNAFISIVSQVIAAKAARKDIL